MQKKMNEIDDQEVQQYYEEEKHDLPAVINRNNSINPLKRENKYLERDSNNSNSHKDLPKADERLKAPRGSLIQLP